MTTIERLSANGIRRIGSPQKGFRYKRSDGKRLSRIDRARIESLKIPPAWIDVHINPASATPPPFVVTLIFVRW